MNYGSVAVSFTSYGVDDRTSQLTHYAEGRSSTSELEDYWLPIFEPIVPDLRLSCGTLERSRTDDGSFEDYCLILLATRAYMRMLCFLICLFIA